MATATNQNELLQSVEGIEKALLLSLNLSECEQLDSNTCSVKNDVLEIVSGLHQGDFNRILRNARVQELLGNCSDLETLEEVIQTHLKESSRHHDTADTLEWLHLLLLLIAAVFVLVFIQLNWINPNAIKYDTQLVPFYQIAKSDILSSLAIEEANVYDLVHGPEFLILAKTILQELSLKETTLKTVNWWLFRVYCLHEIILDEKSPHLFKKISNMINNLSKSSYINQCDDWQLKITFHLEATHILLHFYEMGEALKQMNKLKEISGLNITLTGALGRRTRFQQKAVSQLIVIPEEDKSTRRERSNDNITYNTCILPKNIELNHDTLLNNIEYVESSNKPEMTLHPEEQAALLLQCLYIQQSNPSHELVNEEMMPYIQHVLSQPKVWAIHRKCLVTRSRLENQKPKTIERAMLQMEEIVGDYMKKECEFAIEKFQLFFAIKPFSQWEVEKQLAKLLMSLGVVKNALDVFTRLQMWDEMILCYNLLERRHKAEELIRELLAKNKTVKLLCLLGDSTDDIQHYQRAYEMSGQRSARAQRSIGNYYYARRNYPQALPYFLKSVEINYLQPEIWFSVAYCANNADDHELAARAYRRCVCIEPESFEAWNNLSNSYIQLKDYVKAFNALHEAVKLNYDNWHIWENLMIVAADCGYFNDVIKACHRLLDLKDKHIDTQVLQILVRAITENLPDADGQESKNLTASTLELFGRITSIVTSNADVWDLYGKLCSSVDDQSTEQLEKILHHRQKAHRCLIHDLNWFKDKSQCTKVMTQALILFQSYHSVSEAHQGSLQTLSSCRLMLKGIISTVQKMVSDSLEPVDDDILKLLADVKDKYELTLSSIEALSGEAS